VGAAAADSEDAEGCDEEYEEEDEVSKGAPQPAAEAGQRAPAKAELSAGNDDDAAASLVGRAVLKEFGDDGWFAGAVVAAVERSDGNSWTFEVAYEDGDVEALSRAELNAILQPAAPKAPAPEGVGSVAGAGQAAAENGGGFLANDGERDRGAEADGDKEEKDDSGADDTAASPSAFHAPSTPGFATSRQGAAAFASPAAAPIAEMSVEEMMVRSFAPPPTPFHCCTLSNAFA